VFPAGLHREKKTMIRTKAKLSNFKLEKPHQTSGDFFENERFQPLCVPLKKRISLSNSRSPK
jgi:hypothetical protein